jgi:hypothetical protein
MARRPFRDVMFRRWMPDGSLVYHLTSGDPVFDADGNFHGYRGIGKNIADEIRAQERIERLATVDALTQLSNRQTFDERAGRLLATSYGPASAARCCSSTGQLPPAEQWLRTPCWRRDARDRCQPHARHRR